MLMHFAREMLLDLRWFQTDDDPVLHHTDRAAHTVDEVNREDDRQGEEVEDDRFLLHQLDECRHDQRQPSIVSLTL